MRLTGTFELHNRLTSISPTMLPASSACLNRGVICCVQFQSKA